MKTIPFGERFGKLKVIGIGPPRVHADGVSRPTTLCLCDCGISKAILTRNLTNGLTTSCGCWQREVTRSRSTVHGYATRKEVHPIYIVWKAMWRRCTDPQSNSWPDYGGRGIGVCERWEEFINFKDDMLPTWKPGLTIERVNNSKGYSKENCIWTTRKEQNNNKRNVHPVTFNGQTKTITDWGRYLGGNDVLIHIRLRRGWTMERALSTPVKAL